MARSQPRTARTSRALGYAELRCKSNFSFLEGASHPDELVTQAAALGLAALAVTDLNSLAGIVRAHVAAKEVGLKLIVGAEITPADGPPVLLYAPDRAAYQNLTQLITRGRRAAPKGACHLALADVADFSAHLLAAVLPPDGLDAEVLPALHAYREIFGDRCYLATAQLAGPCDEADLRQRLAWSRTARLPLLAVNDVLYHVPRRRPLHDVLTALRHHTTVAELGAHRPPNGQRHLKSAATMAELFALCPTAVARTVELADRCTFTLDELRYEYPGELSPPGVAPAEHLAHLAWAGAHRRYPQGIPRQVAGLLERELQLIAELRYEAYFLTVWDLVQEAERLGILCQGRGSAANSVVCYCLGITSVNPDEIDVLFERFVSRERDEAPDIDVDFEHSRREEIFQYIWRKYGRERAALVAEVVCYRARLAVRDVGKALGLSLDAVDRIAKRIGPHGGIEQLSLAVVEGGLDPEAAATRRLLRLATELVGFPRHLSQHVGGLVITRGPPARLVPTEAAAIPPPTVVPWAKNDIDALGILKVDCLALGMLTAIRKCFALVREQTGLELTLASVPAEDPTVYDMLCEADTIGTFQVESRAQMSMLPRLRPRCFYDLVIQVAIVRPGPIQGGMVHPYLRRRNGEEAVDFPSPQVEQVLRKTLGVPLFQEQAMRLAVVAAGFSAGQADQFRRAMGAWGKEGVIEKFRKQLLDGMLARGYSPEFAERLYAQLSGFGQYGFPESHAASFARLAYISAWLKRHHPACFTAALLNSQPMGFYAPAQLVRDAVAHGIAVRPPDVNLSDWDTTLEADDAAPAIRLGLRLIHGLAESQARSLSTGRAETPFRSLHDTSRRGRVRQATLLRLAAADAFGSLGLSRRQALWRALAVSDEQAPLFVDLEEAEQDAMIPELALTEAMHADYDALGLSLKAHPLELLRPDLAQLGAVTAAELLRLPHLAPVQVAGLVLVRQRPPTAKGTVFVTLEDETGLVNLVVWRHVWERWRRQVQGACALFVAGRLERAGQVIHVMPDRLDDLSQALRGLATRSRDFR
ncbi:MAG TPA: error-prone DNA polymerase [Gemmatales bacterium]|nr:error-prone DNA polymerase [Gemmatales bacterium]